MKQQKKTAMQIIKTAKPVSISLPILRQQFYNKLHKTRRNVLNKYSNSDELVSFM
jgi:hypothetical protein